MVAPLYQRIGSYPAATGDWRSLFLAVVLSWDIRFLGAPIADLMKLDSGSPPTHLQIPSKDYHRGPTLLPPSGLHQTKTAAFYKGNPNSAIIL